jgi:hypothetical protein
MKKWLLLIPLFLFACKKKEDNPPLAKVNQSPSKITLYNVDVNNELETLRFNFNLFYNSINRIDSIRNSSQTYIFDYALFAASSKIKLNYNSSVLPYDILTYDNVFYNLISYKKVFGINDTSESNFLYDSINRLKRYEYTYNNSVNDFIITQTYKKDTVFVHNELPNSSCVSDDTIKNSTIDMSKTLPYLLFTKLYNSCSTAVISADVLSALPLTSFTNKLPLKIISNNIQADYSYTYDIYERVIVADVSVKNRALNTITSKNRIKLAY